MKSFAGHYSCLCIVVTFCLLFIFSGSGCSNRRNRNSPYAKEVTITLPTQYESLFARIERAYRRGDIDSLIDSISRDCAGRSQMAEYTGEIFRKGEKHTFSMDITVPKQSKSSLKYEVTWHLSYRDIYNDRWRTYKGHSYFYVSCGAVPRIRKITGPNPFLIRYSAEGDKVPDICSQ